MNLDMLYHCYKLHLLHLKIGNDCAYFMIVKGLSGSMLSVESDGAELINSFSHCYHFILIYSGSNR